MISLLDLNVNGRTVAEAILEPVLTAGGVPIVVDVGARNGMWSLPAAYAKHARLVGFEPNREEFERLRDRKTDADTFYARTGEARPRFHDEQYYPYALWDKDEERTLYITRAVGAASMMGPVHDKMKKHFQMWPGADTANPKSVFQTHFDIAATAQLQCRTLDSFLGADKIDFLKMDVEGAELRVLHGAEKLLARRAVLFIETEFQLFPYYQEHPLLGDQHRFLAERGFRLLDFQFNHARQRRGGSVLPEHNDRVPLAAGDAFLCLDPDGPVAIPPLDLHRLAAISLVFGFSSWSISLLRDAGLLPSHQIDAIETAIRSRPLSWRRRLLQSWNAIPESVWRNASRVASVLRGRT
jgi:FkbM family methyltransferase